jgi:hypothetical protein
MFFPDPGSDFFSIPDPNRLQPGSRILIKDLSNLSPKKAKKWFKLYKTDVYLYSWYIAFPQL